jgi:hypothetical protein
LKEPRPLEFLNKNGGVEISREAVGAAELEFLKGFYWDMRQEKKTVMSGKGGGANREGAARDAYLEKVTATTKYVYEEICLRDLWWEFRFLKIVTKGAGVVSLKNPKAAQRRLAKQIIKQENAGLPVRFKIGKSRRAGISTMVEAYIYLKTKRIINSRAMVIADKAANSVNLYSMYKDFYARDPTHRAGRMMEKTLVYDMLIDHQLDGMNWSMGEDDYDISDLFEADDELQGRANSGWVRVESGYNKQSGRSFTIQFMHCSEVAFWENPEESMTALMQVVAHEPNTAIFYETTGNGVGNWWYDCWHETGDGFEKFFLPWLEDEDCADKIYSDSERKKIEDTLDEEESKLIEKDHATLENIKFRRRKLGENHGNYDLWAQEYPLTEEDMFIGTGRPVFPSVLIREYIEGIDKWKKDRRVKRYQPDLSDMRAMQNGLAPPLELKKAGDLWAWEPPLKGHHYIVGADSAEGIVVNQANKDPDFSAIQVFDRGGYVVNPDMPMVQVAEYMARVEVTDFAFITWAVAAWYNKAWVAPEHNMHGADLIKTLLENYKYVMKRPSAEMVEYVKTSGKSMSRERTQEQHGGTARFGWRTAPNTRPFMIDEVLKRCRMEGLVIRSERLLAQMQNFIYDDLGRPRAQSTKHDDLVFATALCVVGDEFCPRPSAWGPAALGTAPATVFRDVAGLKPGDIWMGGSICGNWK